MIEERFEVMLSLLNPNDKITLTFNTSRFGVKLVDGAFPSSTTIGEVHSRVRKKLIKAVSGKNSPPIVTYLFLRNGTESFIPPAHLTLDELYSVYAVSRDEPRTLSVAIDSEIISG